MPRCKRQINRAVLFVQLHDDIENDLMIGLIKRFAIDDLHDVADHLLVEQHRSQHAHLGFDIVRREFVELASESRIDELTHGCLP